MPFMLTQGTCHVNVVRMGSYFFILLPSDNVRLLLSSRSLIHSQFEQAAGCRAWLCLARRAIGLILLTDGPDRLDGPEEPEQDDDEEEEATWGAGGRGVAPDAVPSWGLVCPSVVHASRGSDVDVGVKRVTGGKVGNDC